MPTHSVRRALRTKPNKQSTLSSSHHVPSRPAVSANDDLRPTPAFDDAGQFLPRRPVRVPQPRTRRMVADVQRQMTVVVPVEETSSWLPCSGSSSASSRISPGGEGKPQGTERPEDRPSPPCRPSCTGRPRRARPAQAGSGRPASGWLRSSFPPVRSSPASASKLPSQTCRGR